MAGAENVKTNEFIVTCRKFESTMNLGGLRYSYSLIPITGAKRCGGNLCSDNK